MHETEFLNAFWGFVDLIKNDCLQEKGQGQQVPGPYGASTCHSFAVSWNIWQRQLKYKVVKLFPDQRGTVSIYYKKSAATAIQ